MEEETQNDHHPDLEVIDWDSELEEIDAQRNDMENEVNWDDELVNLNDEESVEEIKFDMIASRIFDLVQEWGSTRVYAQPPSMPDEEGQVGMKVSEEDFEGSIKTSLGDLASVPLMGAMADIIRQLFIEGGGVVQLEPETVQEHRHKLVEAVISIMTEGILISHSPEWVERFDEVSKGLRD